MYAVWSGSGWDIEAIDTEGWSGMGASLALDSHDYPHISYYRAPAPNDPEPKPHELKYAAWNGSSWEIEIVDASPIVAFYPAGGTSLALDANDRPHVAYSDPDSYDPSPSSRVLKYAAWNGSTWDIQTVDSGGDVGQFRSLALDANGYPHISYRDFTNRHLKYAAWNGTSWDVQTVDYSWKVGQYTSLALDGNGYPHISYYDWIYDTTGSLKYAAWNGTSWNIETVDSGGSVGQWNLLALDPSGDAHISYFDKTNRDLKYATTRVPTEAWHNLPRSGYYMISFPLTPTSTTPHDLLSDDLGDGNYYMWGWDAGGYTTVPTNAPGSQTTNLNPQQGYWLLSAAATLDIDVGGALPHGDQSIPLQTGWNMVVAPYEATIDSLLVDNGGDVRSLADAESAGWVLATFYTSHDGTGSYSTVSINQTPPEQLSLWHGYWTLAGVNCYLVIPPASAGGTATAAAAGRASVAPGWAFDIHAVGEGSADSITIAAADGASDGFDGFALDRPKPPAAPGESRLRMALTLDGLAAGGSAVALSEFAADTRSAAPHKAVWEFSVAGGAAGETVTLSWPELSRLPKDRVAILEDRDTGKRTFMRTRAQYQSPAPGEGGRRSFAVTVKPAQETGAIISGFSAVPLRGGRGAELTFSLARPANVQISVLNVAGRLVQRVLPVAALEAGTHTVAWTGRSISDTVVPNGLYLCVLNAKTEDGQQARRVCPLAVSR